MNWEEEIQHIVDCLMETVKRAENAQDDSDQTMIMYNKGVVAGARSVMLRLQVALDEARKSKLTD